MIAQRTCAQYTLTTNTLDLIHVFSKQTFLLVIFIFLNLISISLVQSQPLNLPAERFLCGPLNFTCQRWGYTACVSPDGEFYCLPCHHEYLRTLCGTKDEVRGCNLYCTDIRVNAEVTKLKSDFSRQTEVIKNNFTNILTDAQTDFNEKLRDQQAELIKCDKGKELYINRTRFLEKELSKGSNFTKWVLGGVAASYVAAGVCLVIWCLMSRKRDKTGADIETSEQLMPLSADDSNSSISELSEESEVKKESPCPSFQDRETQTEHDNENTGSKGKGSEQLTESAENGCPTKKMFQNVPPATENGSDKMAIQNQDYDCTLNKHT